MAGLAVAGLAVVVGAVVWALTAGGGTPESPPSGVSAPGIATVGSPAPDFELATFDGEPFRLSDQRGRVVLVNFWASWCNPCRKEFPLFAEVYERYRADGLVIAGVASRDISSDSRDFAREEGAEWPLMSDRSDQTVARAYGVRALPQTFFVDRDGRIAERMYGIPSAARLDGLIRRLLES